MGGRFEIQRLLARSPLTTVYLALQLQLERQVTLRVLHRSSQGDAADFVARCRAEAARLSALTHPNLVKLLDAGEMDDGDPYLIMELLEGRPLAESAGPLELPKLYRLALDVAQALRKAHEAGVCHLDLKPSNIILLGGGEEEVPKLLGLGLWSLLRGTEGRRPVVSATSAPYLSPEHLQGGPLTAQSDLYMFGATLHAMATGRPPFAGTVEEIVEQHLHAPAPFTARSAVLDDIIQRCLAKRPAERFAATDELVRALRLAHRPERTSSISRAELAPPPALLAPPEAGPPADPAEAEPPPTDDMLEPILAEPGRAQARSGAITRALAVAAMVAAGAAGVGSWLGRQPREEAAIAPAPVRMAKVRFRSDPGGAEVLEGEVVLGRTPFELELAPGPAVRRFRFRAPGHEDSALELPVDEPGSFRVSAALRPLREQLPPDEGPRAERRPRRERPSAVRVEREDEALSEDGAEAAAQAAPAPQPTAEATVEPAIPAATEPPATPVEPPQHTWVGPEPKKVAPRVLAQTLVWRVDPQLPASVLAQRRGEELRFSVLVCVDKQGAVDAQRTRMIATVPGIDEAVLGAVRTWRYRAQPVPLCSPVHFAVVVPK